MNTQARNLDGRPWYKEPWPWIIIGMLGAVILASLITLGIAISNPDALVVDDEQYREIKGQLRAQETGAGNSRQNNEAEPSSTDDDG